MRICLELTSSGSQLALHRTLSKGLTVFCGDMRQSSPRRAAAPSQFAPRRAARPDADDAAGLRRVARRPLPVNAAGARHPNLEYPSFALKMRASAMDTLADLNTRALLRQARQQDEVTDPRARARHLENRRDLQRSGARRAASAGQPFRSYGLPSAPQESAHHAREPPRERL